MAGQISADKLVTMANQIGKFFVTRKQADTAAAIADHLRKFWDSAMRAALVAHEAQGGAGLDEPVREAVRRLRDDA
jgi:formate dehydrogenase subunit delta